ncbi:amino acid ABC transporter permease [Breoghania sp.]|uniref:amino acid ABC transporter permease n=1 Tax=Breoghania sp. TaxID=2065378 RepID=UPI002AA69429|nr:amino acid ABC transporter permease [Breoghania sp.]
MMFDYTILTSNWREIFDGICLSLELWLGGSLLGLVLGLALATVHHYGDFIVRALIAAYVGIFRGTPLLIQLFVLYYGGPSFGLVLSPVAAGLIGLTIYGSAQFVEIFRAGFAAIGPGQIEAAKMSGLGAMQTLWHIQIPQMLLIILPSLVNMMVIMTKETAILSVISIPELTAVMSGIGASTYAFAETLFALAAFYWVLLEGVSAVGRLAENRVSRYLAK